MTFRFLRYYMDIAKRSAEMSYAKRLKVGAVIVKDDKIISTSWNGTPRGWSNVCEHEVNGELKTKDEVAHAEEMAISKLAKNGDTCCGATMFITHAPCMNCARLIYNAGITAIYYEQEYRNRGGIEFLEKCGISVQKLGENKTKLSEKQQKVVTKLSKKEFAQVLMSKFSKVKDMNGSTVKITTHELYPGWSPDCMATIESSVILINSPLLENVDSLYSWIEDTLWNQYEKGNITIDVE